jgi:3-isopropylmalate/(R)-2-methylmalate dehydratase small subunit
MSLRISGRVWVFGDDLNTHAMYGDTGTFDLTDGTWRNDTTGECGTVPRLPDLILDIIASGGVLPRLAQQGYLPAKTRDLLRSSAVQISGAGGDV